MKKLTVSLAYLTDELGEHSLLNVLNDSPTKPLEITSKECN